MTEPFDATVAKIEQDKPPMWNNGIALIHTSLDVSSNDAANSLPLDVSAPRTSGTTFDFDVVPDVLKSKPIPLVALTSGGWDSPEGETSSRSGENQPAGLFFPAMTYHFIGIFAFVAAFSISSVPPVSRNRATIVTPHDVRASKASASVIPGSRGTAVHCAATDKNALAPIGPVGTLYATMVLCVAPILRKSPSPEVIKSIIAP